MKSLWQIKNRRGRREAPRLSLFPFLAVLICIMGALVPLLLWVMREARMQVVRDTAAKNAEKQSSIASEMELAKWRVDQLKASRKETAAQLVDARLVLGHIEDHARRLRDQYLKLSQEARKAAAEGLKPGHFVAPGEAELRQLEGQIAEARKRLAAAQRSAAKRPKTYAIVPYDGPNSTRRRPIYIECRGDAIVLQPENIVFGEADFDEPLGPGNPLAAAVRAAREQMLLQHSIDPRNAGEPYPLLLVRPAGIASYECALAAMKSWGSEFGYEMIDEDWQLNYPPSDPNATRAIAQAVELARREHLRLIAAAPSKYGKRPRSGAYRSSMGAGDTAQGGGGDGVSPGFYSSKPSARYGQASAARGSSSGSSGRRVGTGNFAVSEPGGSLGSGDSGNDSGGDGPSEDAKFAANNPYASLPIPGGSGAGPYGGPAGTSSIAGAGGGSVGGPGGQTGMQGGQPAVGGNPLAQANAAPPNSVAYQANGQSAYHAYGQQPNQSGGQPGSPNGQSPDQANGQPATGSPAAASGAKRPDGYIAGQPCDQNPNPPPVQPNPASGVAMVPAAPLRPGEWRPTQEPPKPDPEQEKKDKEEKKKHPYDDIHPDHDQDDWALRDASRHAAAVTRPIHVDCYPDRVVIVPEAGNGEPRVIICDRDGERNANKVVAAVWEIMDAWGMAGREMYWRPVLDFYVVPGAEPQMLDLARSLEGSGLVIERKR